MTTEDVGLTTETKVNKSYFAAINPLFHLLTPLKYNVFESIMENGTFAPLEQMLHFHFP